MRRRLERGRRHNNNSNRRRGNRGGKSGGITLARGRDSQKKGPGQKEVTVEHPITYNVHWRYVEPQLNIFTLALQREGGYCKNLCQLHHMSGLDTWLLVRGLVIGQPISVETRLCACVNLKMMITLTEVILEVYGPFEKIDVRNICPYKQCIVIDIHCVTEIHVWYMNL